MHLDSVLYILGGERHPTGYGSHRMSYTRRMGETYDDDGYRTIS